MRRRGGCLMTTCCKVSQLNGVMTMDALWFQRIIVLLQTVWYRTGAPQTLVVTHHQPGGTILTHGRPHREQMANAKAPGPYAPPILGYIQIP